MSPGAVVPESTETRIARLESSRDDHSERLRMLQALPAQYAVAEERMSNFRDDLNEGLKGIRDEITAIKKETADRAKERRTMLIALFVAGIGLFGTFLATLVPLLHGAGH